MSQEDIDSLKNASAIIERFGGIRPMAAKVGAPVTTVQGWKKRDVIPGTRRDDVLKAANENNIDISDLYVTTPVSRLSDALSATDEAIQSTQSNYTQFHKNPANQDGEKENIKISVEPIIRPQAKPLPSSFTPRSEATHEELMSAISKGQKKAFNTSLWSSLFFVAVLGGTAAMVLWPSVKKVETHDRQIQTLNKDVRAMNESADSIKNMVPDDVRERMAALKTQADSIATNVQAVTKQAQDISKTVLASEAGSLSDRLSVVEAKLGEVQGGQALQDLATRIRGLEVSAAGQSQLGASVAELTKIVDSLDGQVNALDNRLAQTQQAPESPLGQTLNGISGSDLKAAALLIAFSQLRDSLNRNAPFEDDVVLLQKLVGNDQPELQQALTRLAPQAQKGGVLTSEGLSDEFKGLAGDIVFSSLKGEDVSMTDKAKVRLTQALNLKKDGQVVGGTPTQQAVAQAQAQLDSGDVQGALATLKTLDAGAQTTAAPFIQQAEATVLADQIQAMLRQMIITNVGAGTTGVTATAPTLKSITDKAEAVLPGPAVVRDEQSGFSILPAPKGFKGFSSVPSE